MEEDDEFYNQDEDTPSKSQENSSSSLTETYMIGFVIASIVGIRKFSRRISEGQMVGLVREPLNPDDKNAIKVLNTRNFQVGHIERDVADVLSPMIDHKSISIEGSVLNTCSPGNHYEIPCKVRIFSRMELISNVKTLILAGGLQLISDPDVSLTLVKETTRDTGWKGFKNVDEFFDLVDKDVKKKCDLVSVEPPKNAIKSELFVHQKEALGWLVHRENSDELPPFWEKQDECFVNLLTKYSTDKRPEPLRGGIFADDMGLGKTLTLLSLIAFDKYGCPLPYPTGNTTEVTNFSSAAKGKFVGGIDKSSTDTEVQTTLVVCPPSVIWIWVKQLEQHTVPGTLKTYTYHGDRTGDDKKLKKYDIVFTTYSILGAEMTSAASPLKRLEWRRAILDEAHIIKNEGAFQSQAIRKLNAKRRWVVTGTPIQNGSFDLFPFMEFLRFEPFSAFSYWIALVQWPLAQGMQQGLKRLQVLTATITLRRTKDKVLIELPSMTVETHFVELAMNERELYDEIETEAKNILRGYIKHTDFLRNYSKILSIIFRLRQICTDTALCPADHVLLFPSINIGDISNKRELLIKMAEVVEDGEDFDCPICIFPPSNTVITRCAHIFCRRCILRSLHHSRASCPICRSPLSNSDLFAYQPKSSKTDDAPPPPSSSSSWKGTSSKVSALLGLLLASRDQNPSRKSIVFSQMSKMLVRLEEPLKAAGFDVLRLEGRMEAKKRARIIEEFSDSTVGSTKVLLASLKTSIVGINLTAASRVYLLEPWWNPAVEQQAIDRVHRIGQKEDVKLVRLIVRNSIEERVLRLQEKKKELVRDVFARRKTPRQVSLDDVRSLMSL